MGSSALWLLLLLLPMTVLARDFDDVHGPGFDAPPLETANLAMYTIFFLTTLVQVIFAVTYLVRSRSPHRVPCAAVLVVLLLSFISYGLFIAITIAGWNYDHDSELIINRQEYLNIEIPTLLFEDWVDIAMFAAVALILRDRYHTCTKYATSTKDHLRPLRTFSIVIWLLMLAMVITSTASVAVFGAAYATLYSPTRTITLNELNAQINLSARFDYAFVAFDIFTTIFLLAFALVVKRRAKDDKILSSILRYVMSLLGLHALARLIFAIINALLPHSSSFTDEDAYAIDLSSTIVYGALFVLASFVLLHLFTDPRRWYAPGMLQQTQYNPSPILGTPSPQQQFYLLGGIPPGPPPAGQPHGLGLAHVAVPHEGIHADESVKKVPLLETSRGVGARKSPEEA